MNKDIERKKRFEAIEARMNADQAYGALVLEAMRGMKDFNSPIYNFKLKDDVLDYLEGLGSEGKHK
jgi:hypothetical protein